MLPAPTSTPIVKYRCQGCVVSGASNKPAAISATPSSITMRGPKRSIARPISGLTAAETRKPNEKAPAGPPPPHRHREKRHRDDDPAIKEGQPPHQITHPGGFPRGDRRECASNRASSALPGM